MKQKSLELYNNPKTRYLKLIIIFIVLAYFYFSYFSMINYMELIVILRINENKITNCKKYQF
jgi:hypothetical protein